MSAMPADREHPGEHPGDAGRDADLDAAFAEIVAGWDDEVLVGDERPWPASEDGRRTDDEPDPAELSEDTTDRPRPAPTSMEQIRYVRDHGLPTPEPEAPAAPGTGPRDWELAEEPEGHFVPPDPPRSTRLDTASQLAWAAVLIGPAFLLFAGRFWRDVGRIWLAIAAAAFVGGFVALVVRLPSHRDDDGDDGAVV